MIDRLRQPVSPALYRRVTQVALVLLVLIVVTGAGVRLTGSGLGCSDWPACTDKQFVATSGTHALIESSNRNLTGVVSVVVVLAVLGSVRRRPRRRDLVWLSWGLVAGVVGQIVLGGLVVLSHLNPWLVQGHFVVSMLLVLDAVVLADRAGIPDGLTSPDGTTGPLGPDGPWRPNGVELRPTVTPALHRWGRALVGLAALVIVTGTLVTGSGPHSGHKELGPGATDAERLKAAQDIKRLPLAVHEAARVHGIAMMIFLGVTIWVLVQLRRHHAGTAVLAAGSTMLTVLVLQAAIGYTQYFTGVPPLLVALHVLGATLVWVTTLRLLLKMRAPVEQTPPTAPDSGGGLRTDHLPHGDLLTGR